MSLTEVYCLVNRARGMEVSIEYLDILFFLIKYRLSLYKFPYSEYNVRKGCEYQNYFEKKYSAGKRTLLWDP